MIYLDYAATAPLRPEIALRISELSSEPLGNPSSLHRAGRRARMILEQAREKCSDLLGAKVEEIVFCSGATEADNLAIQGVLTHGDSSCERIITSEMEHAAVFETVKRLQASNTPVTWLNVNTEGLIALDQLRQDLESNPKCALVSVIVSNNEVGAKQDLLTISKLCREHGALLHADGVQDPQTACKLIKTGAVDLLALSGHKMGGLHGGLLYVRQGVPVNPQILGGAQEDGRRAGTSELLRAESLAMALEATLNTDPETTKSYRDKFESQLLALPKSTRLGPKDEQNRVAHISSWLFDDLPAEPILVQLDMKGVCASSGSACSSHSVEPSRVIKAMGYNDEQAMALVRFSFGWNSKEEEIQRAAQIVGEVIDRMMSKERKRR